VHSIDQSVRRNGVLYEQSIGQLVNLGSQIQYRNAIQEGHAALHDR
jgi:hypothetical protein